MMRNLLPQKILNTLIFFFILSGCCFAQRSGEIIDFEASTLEPLLRRENFLVEFDLVKHVKKDNLTLCKFLGLSEDNTARYTDVECTEKNIRNSIINFPKNGLKKYLNSERILVKEYDVEKYERRLFYEISKKITDSINSNIPVLLTYIPDSFSSDTIYYDDLVIAYDGDILTLYNSVQGINSISIDDLIRSNPGKISVLIIDPKSAYESQMSALGSNFVYKWGKYSLEFSPLENYPCRIKRYSKWIYGNAEKNVCYIDSRPQSEIYNEIEFLQINPSIQLVYDKSGIYSVKPTPSLTKISVIKSGGYGSPVICSVLHYGQIYFGEYNPEKLKYNYCRISSLGKIIDVGENETLELLLSVPFTDKDSQREINLRRYFRKSKQKLLTKFQNLNLFIGKNQQGQTIRAYSADSIEVLFAEIKATMLKDANDAGFTGIGAYVLEDFPSIPQDYKINLLEFRPMSFSVSSSSAFNFTKAILHSNDYFSINAKSFISKENANQLISSIGSFFNPLISNNYKINISFDGSPYGAFVEISSYKKGVLQGYISSKTSMYRGKYKIRVSKNGYKDFVDDKLNLMDINDGIFICNLASISSSEPSICRFNQ